MDGEYLSRTLDSIANASIEAKCFPGCQILVARHGKIVHHKSYGYHTYAFNRLAATNGPLLMAASGPCPAFNGSPDRPAFNRLAATPAPLVRLPRPVPVRPPSRA